MGQHQSTAQRTVAIDEFEKDDVFALGHIILTPKQYEMAVKRWTKLQEEIKKNLLKRGGKAARVLAGDTLPEIHAEWLVQSQKYYRWGNAPHKDYWHEHLDWLEEAMKIIRHVGPEIHYGRLINYKNQQTAGLKAAGAYETGFVGAEYQAEFEHVLAASTSPYVRAMSLSIAMLEMKFRASGHSYDIICDDYDYCKGFVALEVFEKLIGHGLVQAGSIPTFLSSEDEQVIQMADVATYAGSQVAWLQRRKNESASFQANSKVIRVIRDYRKYLLPLTGSSRGITPVVDQQVNDLAIPIYVDMIRFYGQKIPELVEVFLDERDRRIQLLLLPKNEPEPLARPRLRQR